MKRTPIVYTKQQVDVVGYFAQLLVMLDLRKIPLNLFKRVVLQKFNEAIENQDEFTIGIISRIAGVH